jgi:hypothetical protein
LIIALIFWYYVCIIECYLLICPCLFLVPSTRMLCCLFCVRDVCTCVGYLVFILCCGSVGEWLRGRWMCIILLCPNIFVWASSLGNEADRYVIIRKILECIFSKQWKVKLMYQRYRWSHRIFLPYGCLFKVWRAFKDGVLR